MGLLRRTKASIIYRATGNLRAVQILLGHSKIENTVHYIGIDVANVFVPRKFRTESAASTRSRQQSGVREADVTLRERRRLQFPRPRRNFCSIPRLGSAIGKSCQHH
jgi:hypothetical protein